MIGLMPDGVDECDLRKLHLPYNLNQDIHFLNVQQLVEKRKIKLSCINRGETNNYSLNPFQIKFARAYSVENQTYKEQHYKICKFFFDLQQNIYDKFDVLEEIEIQESLR